MEGKEERRKRREESREQRRIGRIGRKERVGCIRREEQKGRTEGKNRTKIRLIWYVQ